jgi:hypothetical protein
MKSVIAALAFITAASAFALTNVDKVLNWKATPGITEQEAAKLAREGIVKFLTWDDEGEYCTADDFWGFEYDDARVTSGQPAFAITGYARGPYEHCLGETNFDCRVVFIQDKQGQWSEYFSECEPTTLHDGD